MFHAELRQFPASTRLFNLSEADLHRRIVEPWIAGETVEQDEHHFSPEKAKLRIYEAPELRPDEIGMGRGWGNVTRSGRDVTAGVLERARQQSAPTLREQAIRTLKDELRARAATVRITFPEVVALSADDHPGWRVSERMGVAEQAVWELLHEGGVRLIRGGAAVPKSEWEEIVLSWETWRGAGELSLEP